VQRRPEFYAQGQIDMSFESQSPNKEELKNQFDEAFECKDIKNKIITVKSTRGCVLYDSQT